MIRFLRAIPKAIARARFTIFFVALIVLAYASVVFRDWRLFLILFAVALLVCGVLVATIWSSLRRPRWE